MSKTLIILAREYLQRLRSKAFIVSTILGPLALIAAIAIPVTTTILLEDDSNRTLYVVNQAGLELNDLDLPGEVEIVVSELPEERLKDLVLARSINGYVLLPSGVISGDAPARFVSRGGGGIQFRFELQTAIERLVRNARLREAGVDEEVRRIIESEVGFEGLRITEEGEGADISSFLAVIGYVMALVIYICVFLYGSLVMRSVIEEKTSRVVEVVVSSVRPFQLMLGKVLGVGALGLTQLLIWFASLFAVVSVGGLALSAFLPPPDLSVTASGAQSPVDLSEFILPPIPLSFFVYSILFFIGGYLLYASLFATVGSLVDQESDAQQFMLPIAVPIVLSLLLLGRIIDSPDSTLSVVASLIPFFSPVLMPVRIVVSPLPFWEVPLALLLLFATFAAAVWVGARIYRVGILMYGKRARFSDIVKWARMP